MKADEIFVWCRQCGAEWELEYDPPSCACPDAVNESVDPSDRRWVLVDRNGDPL